MSSSSYTVAQWLAIAPICGLPASRFVPTSLQTQAQTVAQRHLPSGAPSDWVTVCTASLIARGIIYYKNVPGDCGTPPQVSPNAEQTVGGITAMAGSTLPGIGPFVSAIGSVFSVLGATHAKAVANEQAIICQVAGIINQVFYYYDAQVANGNLSPSTAYAGMQNFLAQAQAQLSTIAKPCNASCVYEGILAAHADFVQSYYPTLAPESSVYEPQAPGAAPPALGGYPGGVVSPVAQPPLSFAPAPLTSPVTPYAPSVPSPQSPLAPISAPPSSYGVGPAIATPAPNASTWLWVAVILISIIVIGLVAL